MYAIHKIAKNFPLNKVQAFSLQYEMEFENKVVRFFPRDKYYLLDYELSSIFNRKLPPSSFTPVRLKLREAGIVQLGDLVSISEQEFLQFTKDEEIILGLKKRLEEMGLDFGMVNPGWEPIATP